MIRRSGSADLPLHNGRVPQWLAQRMSRLGAVISDFEVFAARPSAAVRRNVQ